VVKGDNQVHFATLENSGDIEEKPSGVDDSVGLRNVKGTFRGLELGGEGNTGQTREKSGSYGSWTYCGVFSSPRGSIISEFRLIQPMNIGGTWWGGSASRWGAHGEGGGYKRICRASIK